MTTFPLDHLFDFGVAVSLAAIATALGYRIFRTLRLDSAGVAETLSFSLFLGTGAVGLLVLGLGLLGLLRPVPVSVLLLSIIAFTARDARSLFSIIRTSCQVILKQRESRITALLFVLLVAVFLLRAATPPAVADELIYHLPVTAQFVEHGRIYPLYDNSLGNMPFLVHMIYALCLIARSDIAARIISLFLAVATSFALYGFCIRFISRRAGVISLFGFFAAGAIVEVAVTTRIDVALAGMLFLTTFAMMNYLTGERRGWLLASALLAGFSLGIKHTAALWLVFIAVLYLAEMLKRRTQNLAQIVFSGVIYTLIALAVASPWYIKNAVWFHNPVYPFITGELAEFGNGGIRYFNTGDERKLDAHFEIARREIPTVVARQETDLRTLADSRPSRHPMRLWEFFLRPNVYLMAEPYQFPNYLFLVIPLIVFTPRHRWIIWLLGLSLAFVFSVTWTSWIARYLIPAYPALTVVAAYTLTKIAARLESKTRFARLLPAYALMAALATVLATSVASIRQSGALQFLTGTKSRYEFLSALPYYRPLAFINSELPQQARIMLIGVQMNYGLERPYYSDESWFATKWRRLLVENDSLDQVNQQLKAQGFTHILYNPSLFRFAAKMGLEGTGGMSLLGKSENSVARSPEYLLLRNWSTFTLYKERYLEPVYTDENGYEVLRIK